MRKLWMTRLAMGALSLMLWLGTARGAEKKASEPSGDYVVFVHGLHRSAVSLKRLERSLKREGYQVINVSYPSTRVTIEAAADEWLAKVVETRATNQNVKIHFVTHSQGGIVVRQYLADCQLERLGRVVMLGPPNQGSELVDHLRHNFLFKLLTGPSGQELGTEPESLPNRLGPARFDVGVIAGDRSGNFLFSAMIPGPDDGKVSVRRAALEGMRDFLVVHHTHTFMMLSKDVILAVESYLKNGRFVPSA